jgi:hypothetical protein
MEELEDRERGEGPLKPVEGKGRLAASGWRFYSLGASQYDLGMG